MAIEKKFVAQKIKEFMINEFVAQQLNRVGLSEIKLKKTPLGDNIIIKAMRPGLVVGRGGANIQKLTRLLKEKFNLENPQIEIEEIKNFGLDANIIAELIVNSLEKYGTSKFKAIGHRALSDVMKAGAKGVEILISGKIPSSRAKTWRFYQGYLKKCGDVAVSGVRVAYLTAVLKTGVVGVKVSILPPDVQLPDSVILHEPTIEEVKDVDVKKEMEELVKEAENKADEKTKDEKEMSVEEKDNKTEDKEKIKEDKNKTTKKSSTKTTKRTTKRTVKKGTKKTTKKSTAKTKSTKNSSAKNDDSNPKKESDKKNNEK